ncbi:MAG: DUF1573 domain-containing protein [Elusimicrobia bacterium]|nr:DUF1573 domain-containing protein [Elusimicrobiota bacterium]
MKWAITLLFLFPTVLWARPKAQFTESRYDFGVLPQGSTTTHTFSVKNVGDKPLKIESVKTTCGCTVASPTNSLIAPGDVGQIQVTFDPQGRLGDISKQIRVETNDPHHPMSFLTIGGTVAPVSHSGVMGPPHNEVNTYESK